MSQTIRQYLESVIEQTEADCLNVPALMTIRQTVRTALMQMDKTALSQDGSMTVEDAVAGVIDLFPSADKQALRVLGHVLAKQPR